MITRLGGTIAPAIIIIALLVVWPGWLRTAQAQSWANEEIGRVRHIIVTLNKSRTLRLDKPFASAVVGAPAIMDALPMSDRVLYIQGNKVGTTDVSMFDHSMKLIDALDVEVAIDTGNLQEKIRSITGGRGVRVRSSNGRSGASRL
jgi:pilus assembly protein CpaC